jgi:Zn-dependent protease
MSPSNWHWGRGLLLLEGLLEPTRLIALALYMLTSLSVHEWAHAWAAYDLGDDTAAMHGRLTLNPLAHIDLLGLLMLIFAGFGWAKPVPVSPHRLRGKLRTSWALVSVAGPLSNFVLAMLAAIPFRMGWLDLVPASVSATIGAVLEQFIGINLALAVFNLIPFPPLDGSRVLIAILPDKWARPIEQLEGLDSSLQMLILLGLSMTGVLALIYGPIVMLLRWVLY